MFEKDGWRDIAMCNLITRCYHTLHTSPYTDMRVILMINLSLREKLNFVTIMLNYFFKFNLYL